MIYIAITVYKDKLIAIECDEYDKVMIYFYDQNVFEFLIEICHSVIVIKPLVLGHSGSVMHAIEMEAIYQVCMQMFFD